MSVLLLVAAWLGCAIVGFGLGRVAVHVLARDKRHRPRRVDVILYAILAAASLPTVVSPFLRVPWWLLAACLCVLVAAGAAVIVVNVIRIRDLNRRAAAHMADLEHDQDNPG